MSDLKNEIRRISNLKNYKNKDKSVVERIAQLNVWRKQINIESKFSQTKDKKNAKTRLDNYLENYEFKDYNDVSNVADLVYAEILKDGVQTEIDKIISDEDTKFVPDKFVGTLHSIEERIWILKEKVGITGKKEQDDLSALQELESKFKTYIAHNRNEFTFYAPINCKECGSNDIQPILLRRRVKNFEALKHPMFSGRFLYNRRGMELVKAGIWTKEQYAWVFHTSVKYVDWCLENENKIVQIDDIEEKEIQDFINNKEYLRKEKIPSSLK